MKMNMKIKKTTKITVGFVLMALVLVVGVPWVYVSAAGGTISACVAKDGDTRLLLSGSSCKKGEQLLSWNIMGPQGLQGIKGDKGDVGSSGLQGIQGPQGVQGPRGDRGEVGTNGATLILTDRFGQALGQFFGIERGATTSKYQVYNSSLSMPLTFISPNLGESETPITELDAINCSMNIYFSEHSCVGTSVIYGSDLTDMCWAANSLTKIGGRYFSKFMPIGHYLSIFNYKSHQDEAGTCVDVEGESPTHIDIGTFNIQEINLPFNFPLRFPLKIVVN